MDQTGADVAVAQASILQREAEVVLWQANVAQAERERERRISLKERGHVSASELDIDFTAVETATAQLTMANASVQNARALARQRQAALSQSELDLERTFIRSPISGTVINRTIEIGQTVAASLQAPELFQIAQDLHEMKVEASVDEADIGRIGEGMDVRFSVDAFPERRFTGGVQQIRRAPDTVANVVTYRVIITASNSDLALLPGMTANVEIVLGSRKDVLTLPNSATRFVPKGGSVAAGPGGGPPDGRAGGPEAMIEQMKTRLSLTADQVAAAEVLMGEMRDKMMQLRNNPDPSAMREGAAKMARNMNGKLRELLNPEQQRAFDEMTAARGQGRDNKRAVVWVLEKGEPTAHRIRVGLADDNLTEVIDGLDEGATVILRASRSGG